MSKFSVDITGIDTNDIKVLKPSEMNELFLKLLFHPNEKFACLEKLFTFVPE